jgi:hypothetical protein
MQPPHLPPRHQSLVAAVKLRVSETVTYMQTLRLPPRHPFLLAVTFLI